jgi:tetratricopeptide (TPR) repeat protein
MGVPDWYRKTTWTENDRRDFEKHYSRAKDPWDKAQYLRIQAISLRDTNSEYLIKEAIGLLTKCAHEFPENPQLPWVYDAIGSCYEKLGLVKETVETYRLALTIQNEFPRYVANAPILLASFVIENDLKDLFCEAETYLAEVKIHANSLKEKIFYVSGCKAIFEAARGDIQNARIHAQQCIAAAGASDSGLVRKKTAGLVSDSKKNSNMFRQVKNLASHIEGV